MWLLPAEFAAPPVCPLAKPTCTWAAVAPGPGQGEGVSRTGGVPAAHQLLLLPGPRSVPLSRCGRQPCCWCGVPCCARLLPTPSKGLLVQRGGSPVKLQLLAPARLGPADTPMSRVPQPCQCQCASTNTIHLWHPCAWLLVWLGCTSRPLRTFCLPCHTTSMMTSPPQYP
jgi:hypothetical protein